MQTSDRIRLKPHGGRVSVYAGDELIADSRQAIDLHETGYPVRHYIPRHDISMQYLQRSETSTRCPYKGAATYYSLELDGDMTPDAAWSYEQPLTDMAMITNMVAFDPELVEIRES